MKDTIPKMDSTVRHTNFVQNLEPGIISSKKLILCSDNLWNESIFVYLNLRWSLSKIQSGKSPNAISIHSSRSIKDATNLAEIDERTKGFKALSKMYVSVLNQCRRRQEKPVNQAYLTLF